MGRWTRRAPQEPTAAAAPAVCGSCPSEATPRSQRGCIAQPAPNVGRPRGRGRHDIPVAPPRPDASWPDTPGGGAAELRAAQHIHQAASAAAARWDCSRRAVHVPHTGRGWCGSGAAAVTWCVGRSAGWRVDHTRAAWPTPDERFTVGPGGVCCHSRGGVLTQGRAISTHRVVGCHAARWRGDQRVGNATATTAAQALVTSQSTPCQCRCPRRCAQRFCVAGDRLQPSHP